jgi:hypothetical protein
MSNLLCHKTVPAAPNPQPREVQPASAFLVADFTGHRQNVYLETGFAMGLGLQVIWTCRKDDIPELHFDVRQYNCIDWENEAELAQRLQYRIEALFGRGPLR